MAARIILPKFGGAAAVWTASLLYFQGALLAGYFVAYLVHRHGLTTRRVFHGLLYIAIITGLLTSWSDLHSGQRSSWPTLAVVWQLSLLIGLPYVCLATSASIVPMAIQTTPAMKYRLFGWSNAGSILGLCLYPIAVEPLLGLTTQRRVWMVMFSLWAIALSRFVMHSAPSRRAPPTGVFWRRQETWRWFVYSAMGVALLMSISSAIVDDLTVSPILWVIPLAVYLLTYVICFGAPGHFQARRWGVPLMAACLGVVAMLHLGWKLSWWLQLFGWSVVLFVGCMVCHGALVHLRPAAHRLPAYYLAMTLGGFVGGIVCAIGAPLSLPFRGEIHLIFPILLWLGWRTWLKDQQAHAPFSPLSGTRTLFACTALILVVGVTWHGYKRFRGDTVLMRNFYGALQVKTYQRPTKKGGMIHLLDGRISHGYQLQAEPYRRRPTTYFAPDSGIGQVLMGRASPRRIAVLGLGVGTLAAYARARDEFVFFELNPQVIQVAQQFFSYLSDARGMVRTLEGDGRLLMAGWTEDPFDIVVVDAFTGDAIPAHLITRQAFELYRTRLRSDGILAINVSNRHADLKRVIAGQLRSVNARGTIIRARTPSALGPYVSEWALVDFGHGGLESVGLEATGMTEISPVFWDDDYAPLLPILK
ncbi:MAG: fused MFS/spermidine synthase [Myxococcota bacterium]|nr:fused MFS/spermidine synthase [Myxococcota bacterium]